MDSTLKIKIFLDKRDNGIVMPDGSLGTQNVKDYYINVNLMREINIIDEFIDIQLDPYRTQLDKQTINPWFHEFGFFESIKTSGISGKTRDYIVVPELQDAVRKARIYSIEINR